jgi:hypothetical protein
LVVLGNAGEISGKRKIEMRHWLKGRLSTRYSKTPFQDTHSKMTAPTIISKLEAELAAIEIGIPVLTSSLHDFQIKPYQKESQLHPPNEDLFKELTLLKEKVFRDIQEHHKCADPVGLSAYSTWRSALHWPSKDMINQRYRAIEDTTTSVLEEKMRGYLYEGYIGGDYNYSTWMYSDSKRTFNLFAMTALNQLLTFSIQCLSKKRDALQQTIKTEKENHIKAIEKAKIRAEQEKIRAANAALYQAEEEKRRKNREYALAADTPKAKYAYKNTDIEYLRTFIKTYAVEVYSIKNTCTRTLCANIIRKQLDIEIK